LQCSKLPSTVVPEGWVSIPALPMPKKPSKIRAFEGRLSLVLLTCKSAQFQVAVDFRAFFAFPDDLELGFRGWETGQNRAQLVLGVLGRDSFRGVLPRHPRGGHPSRWPPGGALTRAARLRHAHDAGGQPLDIPRTTALRPALSRSEGRRKSSYCAYHSDQVARGSPDDVVARAMCVVA
jgi:hypothetical protein